MNSQLPSSEPPKSTLLTHRSNHCLSFGQGDWGDEREPAINKDIVIPNSQDETNSIQDDLNSVSNYNHFFDSNAAEVFDGDKKAKQGSIFLEPQRETMPSQNSSFNQRTLNEEGDCYYKLFSFIISQLRKSHDTQKSLERESISTKKKLNTTRQKSFQFKKKNDELEQEKYKLRRKKTKLRKKNLKLTKTIVELRKENNKLKQDSGRYWMMYLRSEGKNVELEELYREQKRQSQDSYLGRLLYLKSLIRPTPNDVRRQ